jgi:cytochrome c oxidase subunit 2
VGWYPSAHRDGTREAGGRSAGSARRWVRLGALAGVAVVLAGCSKDSDNALARAAFPKAASDRSGAIFDLWIAEWTIAAVVGIGVFGLIVWSVLRYRRRSDDYIPPQVRYNLPIEVLYTLAPIIVIAALFFHTVETQQEIDERVDDPDHTVTVVGQKWGWTFIYEGEESLGGETDVFDVGNPENLAELWLPVDETVEFNLESPDVIHSFWVPEFYYKMDVFPGENDNAFQMTPTREGTFRGRCAEFCGTYHNRMLFDLHVVSAEEYEQHLAELEANGSVGTPTGSTYSTDLEGFEPQEEADQ